MDVSGFAPDLRGLAARLARLIEYDDLAARALGAVRERAPDISIAGFREIFDRDLERFAKL